MYSNDLYLDETAPASGKRQVIVTIELCGNGFCFVLAVLIYSDHYF